MVSIGQSGARKSLEVKMGFKQRKQFRWLLATSSFLLLVAMPFAPSSDALFNSSLCP